MNITKEETGKLTASIKISISREDYEGKVIKTLKDYQRKASMPGFRPGKVPFGVVDKMYRKGIMLDEINHLLSHKLQEYIEENQLRLIGNPMPDKERSASIDLDHQTDFDFYFNIGLAPEFEFALDNNFSADRYTIKAGDKMVDEYVEDIRRRFHDHPHHEGEQQEEGHQHDHEPAALNEDLFKKVFPGEEIKDVDTFREKVRSSIETSLVKESERYFFNSVIEKLVENTPLELPESFIRQMLKENPEKPMTDEELETQFGNFIRSMKWQLIESKIIKDHDLFVSEEEMRNVVKGYFTGHVAEANRDPEHEERLNKIVDSVLSNREEASRLHDQLFDQKLMALFNEKLTIHQKEADYDEFIKIVTQKKD
jgi:FKBP-type peptidyl-prolyl cis-trans isomerase (trigger factor)